MLAAPRFNRFGLVSRFMGPLALQPVTVLLLTGLLALPTAALGDEHEAYALSAQATQTNEAQPSDNTAAESQPQKKARPANEVGWEKYLGDPANAHADATSRAGQESHPPVRAPARSSRRSAAGLGSKPATTGSQPAAEPAGLPRQRGAWVSVARSAPKQEMVACHCPRCGHALMPAGATAPGAEELPDVSSLGVLRRGLLGLGHDLSSVTEPLSPNEPAAVLWEVKQRLGSDPLEGTIFSESDFSRAALGIRDGKQDDGDATFVQWIRSRHPIGAAMAQAPGHDSLLFAQGHTLLASGIKGSTPDNAQGTPPTSDTDNNALPSGPADLTDYPATDHATDEDPEEVRGIETLPLPHSNDDLVECLRESSRQLEIIAHDLERHRLYEPADDLRYMAAQLRREARRHERPEQFAPDNTPAQPGGEPTTTAQSRLRTELLELRIEVARLRELLLRAVGERMGKRR